jgi:hypothetical protein
MKKLLITAAAILLSTSAFAADIATKAPPAPAIPFAYPSADGWYGLIGTEGGGGTVSVSAPGVNTNSLVSNSISIYVGGGYAWNIANSPAFSALEGKIGYTNFNGSAPGLSWQGPLDFHARWLIGAPIDQIAAFFPNLGIQVPTFSNLPTGFTAVSTKYYVAPGFHVSDDSLNFLGNSSKKEWGFSPSITPAGLLVQLKNGSVADFYTEVRLNDHGICTSSAFGQACGRPNVEVLAGLDYKFGIYGLSIK